MDLKEFVKRLDRRDIYTDDGIGYDPISKEDAQIAKREGIVIVYGYSDDNMEFDGAIYDEVSCFNGGTAYVTKDGQVSKSKPEGECYTITAKWYETREEIDDIVWDIPWTYETDIPHEKFLLYDNGCPWCMGIAFQFDNLKDLSVVPATDEIVFAKVKKDAIIPQKEDENAGYDIYACFDEDYMIIGPHATKLVPTGIACALNPKWYFQIEERGSTGSKGIKKSAGIIDSGYRGEIFVAISNVNDKTLIISKFNKEETIDKLCDVFFDAWKLNDDNLIIYNYKKAIAQLILHEVPKMRITEVSYEDLLKISSKRGEGVLGSSGK